VGGRSDACGVLRRTILPRFREVRARYEEWRPQKMKRGLALRSRRDALFESGVASSFSPRSFGGGGPLPRVSPAPRTKEHPHFRARRAEVLVCRAYSQRASHSRTCAGHFSAWAGRARQRAGRQSRGAWFILRWGAQNSEEGPLSFATRGARFHRETSHRSLRLAHEKLEVPRSLSGWRVLERSGYNGVSAWPVAEGARRFTERGRYFAEEGWRFSERPRRAL
jgi:hypothetical protein